MATQGPRPHGERTAYLCTGADCSAARGWRRLGSELDAGAVPAARVPCQNICDGPVCGLELDGVLTWLERVRGRRVLADLRQAVASGQLSPRLRRRVVARRTGQLRAAAADPDRTAG